MIKKLSLTKVLYYFGHRVEVVEVAVVLLKRAQVLVDDHLLYEVLKNNGKKDKKKPDLFEHAEFC